MKYFKKRWSLKWNFRFKKKKGKGRWGREREIDWLVKKRIRILWVCYVVYKPRLGENEWGSRRLELMIKTKFWYPCILLIQNTLTQLTLMVRVNKWISALYTYISFIIMLCNKSPHTYWLKAMCIYYLTSFRDSGFGTQFNWILCSESHKIAI